MGKVVLVLMAQCYLNKGTYGKDEKLSKEKKRAGRLTFLTNFKEKQLYFTTIFNLIL